MSAEAPRDIAPDHPSIRAVITGRARDLGGFNVRRILPAPHYRTVGPFVFLDHMGRATFEPGSAISVRPHPHINLATVTYLFEGEILHRDSLGYEQPIQPGAVNLMTAGRGIVHSERTTDAIKQSGQTLHGMQLWLGVPTAHEEDEPSFKHFPASSIPGRTEAGVTLHVILGSAHGLTSPVALPMDTLYVSYLLEPGASIELPAAQERAIYVAEGEVESAGERALMGDMLLYKEGARVAVKAGASTSRVMLLGGAPLDGGPRHLFWNFVSSRPERIEQAKRDWKEGRFGKVPGDEVEFIPLPE